MQWRALLWLLACVVQCASGSGLWNWAHRGDVRAVLQVPATLAGHHIAATVEWRRRDQQLTQKRVLVTDSADNVIPSHAPVIEEHQGAIHMHRQHTDGEHSHALHTQQHISQRHIAQQHTAAPSASSRLTGVLVFEPPVAGLYYVYWLPYTQVLLELCILRVLAPLHSGAARTVYSS